MVRGISQQAWGVLEPYVTALPLITPVNVNTAAPEVLAAMVTEWGPPLIALGEARRWLGQIDQKPAQDLETFAAMALGRPDRIVAQDLSVTTNYFMSHTWLRFGGIEQGLATMYYRNNSHALMLGQYLEFNRNSFNIPIAHATAAR
jgi:general secretion pathway protein K